MESQNKIYVAVGKDVNNRELILKWALTKAKREMICIVYVHVPSQVILLPDGTVVPISSLRETQVIAFREGEREINITSLRDCLRMCDQNGVAAELLYIEKESIAEGLVELISQQRIWKLVMGAGIENKHSRKMAAPTSRKANYVLHYAPKFCHIWFVYKGRLICTREGVMNLHPTFEMIDSTPAGEASSSSPWTPIRHHGSPISEVADSQPSTSVSVGAEQRIDSSEESNRGEKAEKDVDEAITNAKESEKEEEKLSVKLFQEQKRSSSLLRDHNEWIPTTKEFDEKLLHSLELKQKCEEEHNELMEAAQVFRKQLAERPWTSHVPMYSEFSFLDIEKATNYFDPSLRIWEGSNRSIYKGFLCHTEVAIKRFQSKSLQCLRECHQEVDVSSKLRHPNLVTLIGTCAEYWALIYEYYPNGSLEDRLSCKDNSPPLAWETRIRIAVKLCSALIFLHSSQPTTIIHGNLSPESVLLDANFACKLSDLGKSHIISDNSQFVSAEPKGDCLYSDPEFLETGQLTPQSNVYAFGIILLRLLTGKPALGIVKEVQEALDNDDILSILDLSAGEWPFVRAKQLAYIALRCCDMNGKNRPKLASEVWHVLKPLKAPCGNLSRPLRIVAEDQVPSYFICPIFQEIMQDPHFAADGFTYEADAIRGWFEGGRYTSPMTNMALPNCTITPNRALRSAIQEWLQRNQCV